MAGINSYMEKYRKELQIKKSDYLARYNEIKDIMAECSQEFKEKANGIEDFNERHKIFREVFGELPRQEEFLKSEIKIIERELLDKKFANRYGYTDIEPYEVIEEKTPNRYVIRAMDFEQTEDSKKNLRESFVVGGFLGTYDNNVQEWNITSNEINEKITIRRHRDGNWYDAAHNRYKISDKPIKFYDFNF